MNKEELIINTAIKILAVQNYQGMTTSVLAQAAGIAEGTIYCYFKSKKELFIKVLLYVSERLSELFMRDLNEKNTVKENLNILGNNFARMDDETNTLYKIIYKSFSEVEDEGIKKELGRVYTRGFDIVKQILSWGNKTEKPLPDSIPEMIFMILWGIGDMVWKRLIIGISTSNETARLDTIVDFICTLIAREQE